MTYYRFTFRFFSSKRLLFILLVTLSLFHCDLFDITPPEIEIISPVEGESYFGAIPCEVKATDNRKVAKVEVFIDGASVHEFTKEPYETDISIEQLSESTITLKAIAYDKADNHAEASREVSLSLGFKLTSPNGGESWDEQSTQTITWESSGNVGSTVSLDYSTDDGNNWTEITGSTTNNGTYTWKLPNFIETQPACKIKVSTDQYADESDDAFIINAEPNTLTLTAPNGGEIWQEQSTQIITWTSSGDVGDYVSLDYSLDGGTTWTLIVSSTGNDGSHSWTCPNLLESVTTCRIKVASTTTSNADTSDANFIITAEPNYITIISPNGGETWAEQSTHDVTWLYSGDVGDHVSLGYSIDGGTNWLEIIASTSNDGSHAWNIPNFLDIKSACRVRVASTSTAFADTSNADFTITTEPNFISLTSPNGGEVWAEQSTHNIAWSKNGDVGDYVDLAFSSDGGTSWQTVISYTENDGSHSWVLPNFLETSTTCRVKVVSTSTSFADTSDSDFTITAEPNYITLTSPNGGETWAEQSTHDITWSKSGDVGDYMNLALSLDGGTSWQTIIASTENDGLHSWILPNLLETSTTCRVKVASTTTAFKDSSDANLTITAEPNYLTLTAPNGGEVWDEQSTQSITWSRSGDVGDNVDIHYSLDSGVNWSPIIASTQNDGSHTWTLPNLSETFSTCRVKIASTSTSFADTSDADFTIVGGEIALTSPNGGEVWTEQSNQTITWISSGDVGPSVSLHLSFDSGATWEQIESSISNNGTYSWLLPDISQDETTCRVRVTSITINCMDISNADFTVLVAPYSSFVHKPLASDAEAGDQFGRSVDISGDYAIVGAEAEATGGSYTGAAYIFQSTGIDSWDSGTKIRAPDHETGDYFGASVAINGDYAIVGAILEDEGGSGAGAAYIFYRTGLNMWDDGTKIVALDAQADEEFGTSVAISGEYAIVGVSRESTGGSFAGAAYIFHRTGQNSWDSGIKIMASDAQADDRFGHTVAISGDYAIVGAYQEGIGKAYVFHRTGLNSWDAGANIIAPDAQAGDFFGVSVGIANDYVVVGANREDEGGSDAGAAYIFYRTGLNSWDSGTKIIAPDAEIDDYFGRAVGINGDYVIAGAFREDAGGNDAGAAYIFHRTGENSWDSGVKLVAPGAQASDMFGFSVAISSAHALIGAHGDDTGGGGAGAGYIFK